MYGIDSGNGYVYGEDAVEQTKKEQSEKEEKNDGRDEPSHDDRH